MKDLISIIVPIYKVEKYIKECIESLINQTYKNIEIILVDDGSTDNCPKIIDEYAKKDSRIKVIHQENGGLSNARNSGLKVATGKYVGFVDSDDTVNIKMYETLYNLIEKYNSDVSICGITKTYENEKGEIISPREEEKNIEEKELTKSKTLELMIMDGNVGNFVCTKLFKRELFNDITFPDGKVYEDVATTYKLIHKANKIVYTNKKLYNYLFGRVGAITSSFSEKKILNSLDAYYSQYSFLIENYKEIKDYINIIWVKMYTSAMEKIGINNYNDLWNNESVIQKYESFKKSFDELDSNFLNEHLEPYRLISATLLRQNKDIYIFMLKTLYDNIKNK